MSEGEILYHYTSIEGLNSIINSRCVWASDCRYLNDQKELHDASEIFLSKFNGKKRKFFLLLFIGIISLVCIVFSPYLDLQKFSVSGVHMVMTDAEQR